MWNPDINSGSMSEFMGWNCKQIRAVVDDGKWTSCMDICDSGDSCEVCETEPDDIDPYDGRE